VREGETLYRAGEPADEHFFVASGEIRLSRPGAKDWTMGTRSVVGSLDMLLERPRSRTATATQDTHLWSMRGEDFWDLLEDRFELARRITLNIAEGIDVLRSRPAPAGGFDDPPPALLRPTRGPLNLIARTLLLRTVPLFAHASAQTLTAMAEVATEIDGNEGDLLFPRGSLARQLVVVAAGEVTASRTSPEGTFTFGAGSLVAGNSALSAGARYEVRAKTEARALSVPLDDYYDAMEDHFSLVRSALVALADEREMLLDR
jgi:CRP-like cAMP-binding protein